MHCESLELPTFDEFIDDLQSDLYINGLQMAAALATQLQAELANGPTEDSLKKWYTWTRGLNQLQAFRYAPARRETKEQKQRGRPPQEPKIHLNGPAPQLRKQAIPKSQTPPEAASAPMDSLDSRGPESVKLTKPADAPLTPAKPAEFDQINQSTEKPAKSTLTSLTPTEFDRLYTNLRQGPRTYVERSCPAL